LKANGDPAHFNEGLEVFGPLPHSVIEGMKRASSVPSVTAWSYFCLTLGPCEGHIFTGK